MANHKSSNSGSSGRSTVARNNIQEHREWFQQLLLGPADLTTSNRNQRNQPSNTASNSTSTSNINESETSNKKCGATAGFEYAIQPDGTSLSESIWEMNIGTGTGNQSSRSCFKPFVNTENTNDNNTTSNGNRRVPGQKVRLDQLQSNIEKSSFEYQRRSSLPPPPPPKSQTMSSSHGPSPAAAAVPSNYNDSSQQQKQTISSSYQQPIHGQAQSQSQIQLGQEQGQQQRLAPLSSPLKARNRHNAVYGQHLPNAMNSPGCAAKVFGTSAGRQEERQNIQHLFQQGSNVNTNANANANANPNVYTNVNSNANSKADSNSKHGKTATATSDSAQFSRAIEILDDDDDDDNAAFDYGNHAPSTRTAISTSRATNHNPNHNASFDVQIDVGEDDIFANIDIDQMVAEHKSGKKSARPHNPYSSNDYSHGGTSNSNSTSHNTNAYSRGSDGADAYAAGAGASAYGNGGFDSNYDHRSPLQRLDCNDQRYPSASGSTSGLASARGNDYGSNNSDGLIEPYRESTSANISNSTSGQNYDTSFSSISSSNDAPMFGQNTSIFEADGVPLCPGHNEPCRILTSSTATNNRRQFYKCARPQGDQCDFFEWADGVEGNLNGGNEFDSSAVGMYDGADSGPPPGSKDIFTENRRKFGHHSFREGQKQVIQNAVNGKDVFVLMPTGGGKSLCYQLPAWCCPGLSVIVSPLLSLIEDQVTSMTKLGVETVFLSSQQDYNQGNEIMARLRGLTEHDGIKMLYVTPEKLSKSNMVKSLLRDLARRKLLSRFVIDEGEPNYEL